MKIRNEGVPSFLTKLFIGKPGAHNGSFRGMFGRPRLPESPRV